ncbi:MAG: hypothetical protein H0U76_20410 [Ktedonobacteraceae bacterium]|nr:hypothetical protein [Ktedonobacteraceae bacterium]
MAAAREAVYPTPLLQAWRKVFLNRSLPYVAQYPGGGPHWVHRRCRTRVIEEHLLGSCAISLSSTDEAGWCRWACLDDDTANGLATLQRVGGIFAHLGAPSQLEASRRGGHLWFFLEAPTPAGLVKRVLHSVLGWLRDGEQLAVPNEVYPDAEAAGSLGHAVRLPLGKHPQTDIWYPLLDPHGHVLKFPAMERALLHLIEHPRVPAEWWRHGWQTALMERQRRIGMTPVAVSLWDAPKLAQEAEAKAKGEIAVLARRESHALAIMQWVDANVSPLELLDVYAASAQPSRQGKGYLAWCPFHDDIAPQSDGSPGTPSLYLVDDHYHGYGWSWKCLSSNCRLHAGPMKHSFRLLMELAGLSAGAAVPLAVRMWPDCEPQEGSVT